MSLPTEVNKIVELVVFSYTNIIIYGNKYRKKRAAWAALKNFNDICPIIPVGVGCLIRQP